MTITIDLPEETLAALKQDALQQGRAAEHVAAERLIGLYADESDENAAIDEAFAELEGGQSRPFAEFIQDFSARFSNHYRTG